MPTNTNETIVLQITSRLTWLMAYTDLVLFAKKTRLYLISLPSHRAWFQKTVDAIYDPAE